MFFDETLTDQVSFKRAKKMKNDKFFVLLDNLISDLNVGKVSFSKIYQDFEFLIDLEK